MMQGGLRQAPVVGADGRLIGIVDQMDLIGAMLADIAHDHAGAWPSAVRRDGAAGRARLSRGGCRRSRHGSRGRGRLFAHQPLGEVGIARFQRLDNLHVLADGFRGAVPLPERGVADAPDMHQQVAAQAVDHLALPSDRIFLVEADVRFRVFVQMIFRFGRRTPGNIRRMQARSSSVARVQASRAAMLSRAVQAWIMPTISLRVFFTTKMPRRARCARSPPVRAPSAPRGSACGSPRATATGSARPGGCRGLAVNIHLGDCGFEGFVGERTETCRRNDRLIARFCMLVYNTSALTGSDAGR